MTLHSLLNTKFHVLLILTLTLDEKMIRTDYLISGGGGERPVIFPRDKLCFSFIFAQQYIFFKSNKFFIFLK